MLDEPDRGLDPVGLALVAAYLRKRASTGSINLAVTHHEGFAESLEGLRLTFAELAQPTGKPG